VIASIKIGAGFTASTTNAAFRAGKQLLAPLNNIFCPSLCGPKDRAEQRTLRSKGLLAARACA